MTPAELVRRVQLAVVKSRSNAAESGTLEDCEVLWPRLYGTTDPLSVLRATEHVLSRGDAKVSPLDAVNVLTLAGQQDGFDVLYFLRWQEDPPAPLDVLRADRSPRGQTFTGVH